MQSKRIFILLLVGLVAFDIYFWIQIAALASNQPEIHFLNVGQGDSELVMLPGNVSMLIDGGKPGAGVLGQLQKFLHGNRYIDIMVMTHPQLDHFGGLIDVLQNYHVGVFLSSGRIGDASAYQELVAILRQKKVPYIFLKRGDRITYKDNIFDVLWPNDASILSSELNNTCIVLLYHYHKFSSLFTGDIAESDEAGLLASVGKLNVLKVAHHGSRFSSTDVFLTKTKPDVAVIEVGKNTYGHPTKEALDRLKAAGAKIFRTDKNGNITVQILEDKINVLAEKL